MASTLYSETPASRLTISLESAATSSPFPSPSSSFLTPPTPGAHEFAMKPPPAVRSGRKGSATSNRNSNTNSPAASPRSSIGSAIMPNGESQSKRSSYANGLHQPTSTLRAVNDDVTTVQAASPSSARSSDPSTGSLSLSSPTQTLPVSPVTPTPGVVPLETTTIPPPSPITTPTNHIPLAGPAPNPPHLMYGEALAPIQIPVPPNDGSLSTCASLGVPPSSPITSRLRTNLINRGSRPLSTASTTSTTSVGSSASAFDPALFAYRPAPPSPGGGSTPSLSRKPSTRSKPGSKPVSRANSLRNHRGSSHASSPIVSSQGSTLAGRGEGAATPHSRRVSAGIQLNSRTFSSSSLASPSKAHFDMGISASSPVMQDTAPPSIPTVPSERSSESPSTTTSTSTSVSTADAQLQPPLSQQDEHKVFVKIRDFAFQPADERHNGQGPLVPKTNRVGRMNRRLGGRSYSTGSISSSDGDGAEEDDESDGWGWNAGGYGARGFGYGVGWGGGGGGGGRFTWAKSSGGGAATAATIFDQEKAYATAADNLSAAASKTHESASNSYPSRSDMDLNFLDSESEELEFYDAEDNEGVYDGGVEEEENSFGDTPVGGEDDDEPLYPGLYRALYAFEPEGTAEMRLVEDQIVRVVGRGGGVGWAVVVAEPGEEQDIMDSILDGATKHALVPESYLEPYKLDWELDEGDASASRRTA